MHTSCSIGVGIGGGGGGGGRGQGLHNQLTCLALAPLAPTRLSFAEYTSNGIQSHVDHCNMHSAFAHDDSKISAVCAELSSA